MDYIFSAVTLLIILLVVGNLTGTENRFLTRNYNAIFEGDGSGRMFYLKRGWDEFLKHPLIGGRSLFSDGTYPHNVFLEVLMSTGLIGAVFIIIYYKFEVQSAIRIVKNINRYKEIAIFVFLFVQYFILDQFSGSIIYSVLVWYLSALLIGLNFIKELNVKKIKSNDSGRYTT